MECQGRLRHPVSLYPLTFEPVLKDYRWGGRKLETALGRRLPDGVVAESWEISAHPNGPTPVAAGPLAGVPLPEVQHRLGRSLVGERNADALERDRFPLLVKLLDANDWLSIQVHPPDAYAREHESDLGKTEMWVVLDAEPGAELILGLRHGVDLATLRRLSGGAGVERCLHRQPARAGDAFLVPAGTVHAIGPGLLLAEIQQASDATYRLWDWDRPDPDGSRPLHLERALDVVDPRAVAPGPLRPAPRTRDGLEVDCLADCPYFRTERLTLPAGSCWEGACRGETFEIWGVLEGEIRLESGDFENRLAAVAWVLLPADLGGYRMVSAGGATLLRVTTPASAHSRIPV